MCPVVNRFMQAKGDKSHIPMVHIGMLRAKKKRVKNGDGEMGKGKEHQNLSTFWWD